MIVAELDILLEGLCIAEGCLNTGMPQEPLHLFERHPALEGDGSSSMAEDMGRNMC